MTPSPPGPLLTVRAALVLLLALVVGLLAAGLAYLANHSLPAACLVGGGAADGALLLFLTIIDPLIDGPGPGPEPTSWAGEHAAAIP